MPIIRIRNGDGMLSPSQITEIFKTETNINLHLFVDGKEVSGSELSIEVIWSRHPVLKSLVSLFKESGGVDFIVFLAKTPLQKVKTTLASRLGMAVSLSYQGTELIDTTLLLHYKDYPTHSSLLQKLYAVNQEFIEITEVMKQQSKRSVELFDECKRSYPDRKEVDFEPQFKVDFCLDESDPLYIPNDENLVISYSSVSSGILQPKEMAGGFAFWEKELAALPRKYWEGLSLENNLPILNPCYLFYLITNYLIEPCDLVRMKEYWIEFYHVNQILDAINYENQN